MMATNESSDRQRSKKLLIGGLVALLLAVPISMDLWNSLREPSYKGIKVSQWISQLEALPRGQPPESNSPETVEAIRAIGSEALPFLLKRLEYQEPKLTRIARELIDRQDLIANPLKEVNVDYYGICRTLRVLGTNAQPALPHLKELLYQTKSRTISRAAARSLTELGEPSIGVFIEALSSTNLPSKESVMYGIGFKPLTDQRLVDPLVNCLSSTNRKVVTSAMDTLARLKLQPDKVARALLPMLDSPDTLDVVVTLQTLSVFENSAQVCIPALESMMDHEDKGIRTLVTNVIQRIAPERAAAIFSDD